MSANGGDLVDYPGQVLCALIMLLGIIALSRSVRVHLNDADHRAVTLASKPITSGEDGGEGADGTLFAIDEELRLTRESL